MRVRQYIFVGAVLAVLAAVLVHTLSEERIQVYFDRVEAIPGYKIELREQPLRIAMISVLNHQTTDEYQHAMVRSIGRLLGRPVLLLHRRSYAEINQLLARGDADVAFLSSGAYMVYGKKEDVRYFSYIIVPRTSPAQALSDLRGRRFVYVDPLSYSGYIELRARLRTMGEDPEHFFGSYYFTYSHDDSLRAVADGLVDGGVIASLTYDYYRVNAPAILDKIRLLEALPGSGMGPVVARRDLRDADAVQEILLHLNEDAEAKEAMQHLLIDRFVPPQPELYPQFSPEEGI